MHATCMTHLILLDLITVIIYMTGYSLWWSPFMEFKDVYSPTFLSLFCIGDSQQYWLNNVRLISERFIYLFPSVFSCGYVKCSILYKGDGLRLYLCYSWELALNVCLDASFGNMSHRGGPGSSPAQVMWDLWTKWHWGRFFSEYFGFPYQSSFHRLLHNHHHHLSSGAGTIGQ
jgi:hypothetical protein